MISKDLNKYANWFLPEANSKTINGLLTEYIDQIPQSSVCVEIKNYRFEILEIEDNQISQVKVIKYI